MILFASIEALTAAFDSPQPDSKVNLPLSDSFLFYIFFVICECINRGAAMVDLGSQCSRTSCFGSSNSPSFSSTLLDSIYRSIDQGEEEVVIYREDIRKDQSYTSDSGVFKSEEKMSNFQRTCMIDKWMEKKVSENVVVRRKSVADLHVKISRKDRENSSTCSSDSGGCGGFFSSEAESFPDHRPKPVRTGVSGFEKEKHCESDGRGSRRDRRSLVGAGEPEQKPEHREGGFVKTKSRALKIYGDLKKVKQPISPGGKLAGLLNSLFTAANPKKPKVADVDSPSLKSANGSTCSSASSFSRSCLSKTPSSRGKCSDGTKRSVRFSPSVVDENSQPRGRKSSHDDSHSKTQASKSELPNSIRSVVKEELMVRVMEKNRRVEEVARDLLRNYHRFDHPTNSQVKSRDFEGEGDEEDDAASYASSDLFELDNLSAIGMQERYREELPVYETTHVDTNRAIANGFIL